MQIGHRTLVGGLAVVAAILLASACGNESGVIAAEAKPQGAQAASKSGNTMSFDLGGGVKMEFVLIPAGSFMMGDADGLADERPAHKVTISQPFYMGKYVVTQQQWEKVMGSNPSDFKGPQNPAERVGCLACEAFLQKLTEKFAASGMTFGVPSEAQWEYACRAGGNSKFSFGDAEEQLGDYAWFRGNAGGVTHPVGMKKPNAWGLYDMHGNVFEWCTDWYGNNYYAQSPAADPTGAASGCHRVVRGGCFEAPAAQCRTAYRGLNDSADRNHNVGLRVICTR